LHTNAVILSDDDVEYPFISVFGILEGKTKCEFSWDFQGLSPMLQVTSIGLNPADASHEDKRQLPLLIAPLRQGRLNFNVSPVGGITITQAVTSRESKEGLYDW